MGHDSFATGALPPRDQYAAWRERFQPVLDVSPDRAADGGFVAENQIWRLGDLTVSRVSAPPVRVERTSAGLRRDPVDHWVLTLCRHGATTIRTDKALLHAPAGIPFLWSLGEKSESERTAVERVQIFMPRDAFREVAPLLDQARGSVLDTPMGRLLGDYMLALERRLPTLAPEDLPRLAAAVRAMLVACVTPSAERAAVARDQIDLGRLERVRHAVGRNLHAPPLTPASLARMVGISRSNLYRLLEAEGGVAHYIQRRRLRAARAALADTAVVRPIAAIADDFCFVDASSFSRAFRQEFGHSPSEARLAALAGEAAPESAFPPRGPREPRGFGDLLRPS